MKIHNNIIKKVLYSKCKVINKTKTKKDFFYIDMNDSNDKIYILNRDGTFKLNRNEFIEYVNNYNIIVFVCEKTKTKKTIKKILKNKSIRIFTIKEIYNLFDTKQQFQRILTYQFFKEHNIKYYEDNIYDNCNNLYQLNLFLALNIELQIKEGIKETLLKYDYGHLVPFTIDSLCKNTCNKEYLLKSVDDYIKKSLNIDYIVSLDLEAINYTFECISIGSIINDNNKEFHEDIKPLRNTKPSQIIVDLTGLNKEYLNTCENFKKVLEHYNEYIGNYNNYKFLVYGNFDKTIWENSPRGYKLEKEELDLYRYVNRHLIDVSKIVNKIIINPSNIHNELSLVNALNEVNIEPLEGIHNPLIDAKNLLNLFLELNKLYIADKDKYIENYFEILNSKNKIPDSIKNLYINCINDKDYKPWTACINETTEMYSSLYDLRYNI